jgi:hypothetical protein
MRYTNKNLYSITSSATPNCVGGTAMPSALAVLRLIDSIILVGNSGGISPGGRTTQGVSLTCSRNSLGNESSPRNGQGLQHALARIGLKQRDRTSMFHHPGWHRNYI